MSITSHQFRNVDDYCKKVTESLEKEVAQLEADNKALRLKMAAMASGESLLSEIAALKAENAALKQTKQEPIEEIIEAPEVEGSVATDPQPEKQKPAAKQTTKGKKK